MAAKEIVIVTGSSGYPGGAIARRLADQYTVVGLDRAGGRAPPECATQIDFHLGSDESVRDALEKVRSQFGDRIASVIHLPPGSCPLLMERSPPLEVERRQMRSYLPAVSLRRFFAALMALAVLFAPLLTHAGAASAQVPDHHMQMVESGHCDPAPSSTPGEDAAGPMTCCIAMFTAVPATPPPLLSEVPLEPAPTLSAASTMHVSYLREIATPPPRRA